MKRPIQRCGLIFAIYALLAVLFYTLAGVGFRQGTGSTIMVSPRTVIGEMFAGSVVEQSFLSSYDALDGITLFGATYSRNNDDTLEIAVYDENNVCLSSAELNTYDLPDNAEWHIDFERPATGVKGKRLTLAVTSLRGGPDNAVTLYCGDSRNTGRFELEVDGAETARHNGLALDGQLCLSVAGTNYYRLAEYYWIIAAALGAVLAAYLVWTVICAKRGRLALLHSLIIKAVKYRFLLKQLVVRDFKTKYKRSVLGILWSFLNPLLTMLVLYIVFSTLFKSSIANFPVYLLSGIVVWSFFNEATGMCLSSITGNAGLITKVNVPKYIYPFSRTLSSLVNFMFSLLPLLIVMLITRTSFHLPILLLPFPIFCLFIFALGIGLMLATSMVFFRDTQFLWGVVSTLWMYLTPIFYDVGIIPARFLLLYKMNPLYHLVRTFRIILIQGVSPEPKAYLLCLVASLVPFVLGVIVFKKNENRFVFYL